MKLFEFETILTSKNRKKDFLFDQNNYLNMKGYLKQQKEKEFDKDPHEIRLPDQLQRRSINPNELAKQLEDQTQIEKYAPSQCLKRVAKELIVY